MTDDESAVQLLADELFEVFLGFHHMNLALDPDLIIACQDFSVHFDFIACQFPVARPLAGKSNAGNIVHSTADAS